MNYIILDMEWNQPPHPARMIKKPVPLHGEIVEIGAVKLDADMNTVSTFKTMVAPKHYKKMQKWVRELTHITDAELHSAADFPSAFFNFLEWCGRDCAIFTWGPDDVPTLKTNVLVHGLDESAIPSYYDLQPIFDDRITKEHRQISLSRAMEILGEPALEAHDALNDALNTACIFTHLDIEAAIAEYEEIRGRFMKRSEPAELSRGFAQIYAKKSDVVNDTEMTEFECPVCGARAACYGFASQNPYKYIALGECENGHELFVGFKFKKLDDGRCRTSRVAYEMTEEYRELYASRTKHGAFGRTKEEAMDAIAALKV